MKKGGVTLATLLLMLIILAFSATFSAQADQLVLEEGTTLYYKWARIGQGAGGAQTGNATFKILVANQTTIVARATGTAIMDITIKYNDGIPTYADYLEALIYLPQTCITQSLQGNLSWITKMETSATIANATVQPQQFIVEAGTFQSLKITLYALLKGTWQYGNLTLIYDVNSGILIYEQWIPKEYGDIIIQSLSAVTQAPKPQNAAFGIILTATTFATPTVIAICKANETLKKRKLKNRQMSANKAKIERVALKKPFYMILTGATLNLASTLLPWSQHAETQMYLPLSLQTTLTAQTTLIPTTISLIAHTATILAWIAIAISLYTKMKRASQITALISSILAFTSATMLIQSGWTPNWGVFITIISGILIILGLAVTSDRK